MKTGIELIAEERTRQIETLGWSLERDDEYTGGELRRAGDACAIHGHTKNSPMPKMWPWGADWWKPSDKARNLVKAGALLRAEIDRLERRCAKIAREIDSRITP